VMSYLIPFSDRMQPGTASVTKGGRIGGLGGGLPLRMSQLRLLLHAVVSSRVSVEDRSHPAAHTRATSRFTLATSGCRRAVGAGSSVVEVRVHGTRYAEDSQSNAVVDDILYAAMRLAPRRWRWSR